MAATMLLPPEVLPDVLPSAQLTATGRPRPEVREELRRIPDTRNAVTVVLAWVQSAGVIAAAAAVDHPVVWVAAFFLMGRAFVLLNILGHEAAHRLLFTNKRLNDGLGRWLLAFPG